MQQVTKYRTLSGEKKIHQLSAVTASSTEMNELAADFIDFLALCEEYSNCLTKISNFPTTCHRETSLLSTPPPPNVKLTFLVGKIDM